MKCVICDDEAEYVSDVSLCKRCFEESVLGKGNKSIAELTEQMLSE